MKHVVTPAGIRAAIQKGTTAPAETLDGLLENYSREKVRKSSTGTSAHQKHCFAQEARAALHNLVDPHMGRMRRLLAQYHHQLSGTQFNEEPEIPYYHLSYYLTLQGEKNHALRMCYIADESLQRLAFRVRFRKPKIRMRGRLLAINDLTVNQVEEFVRDCILYLLQHDQRDAGRSALR
jgi:hypothetical protein